MSRIIRQADSQKDVVVVGTRRATQFVPASFKVNERVDPQSGGDPASKRRPLETAKSQAERILSDANSNALAVTQAAMAQGYADGRAEGLRDAEDQIRRHLERIAELAKRATVDRMALVMSAEQELAALALAIAAKVIRREIRCDPALVLSVAEAALEKSVPSQSVRVVVHPEDVDLLRDKWTELRGASLFGPEWEIAGDDRMERGGCVVETRGGVVDGRIDAQLSQIASVLDLSPAAPSEERG